MIDAGVSSGSVFDKGLQPALKRTAGKEDPTATAQALEPDVSSQPDYPPLEAATRMHFAQADNVAEVDLDRHDLAYPTLAARSRLGQVPKSQRKLG